jgi:hypothetical protein
MAMLAALGGAVLHVLDRTSSDPDELSSDQAKSKATARAMPVPVEAFKRCPPERGQLVRRRWHMSEVSRNYQVRVTGFAPYTEWKFESMEFDGFRVAECRLEEAKARYDQFFDSKTKQPKPFFAVFGAPSLLRQARRQSEVVRKNPPATLTWYFMQPLAHRFFAAQFSAEQLPIKSLLHP